jgi:hypothetical protein
VLSLVADIIVNIGMNAMKHAHNINTAEDGSPLKSFLYVPWWWIGVLGIVGGEVNPSSPARTQPLQLSLPPALPCSQPNPRVSIASTSL